MTLRSRLLLASAVILGVVILGGVVLLRTQESYLVDQVDEQLEAARPLVAFRAPPPSQRPAINPPSDNAPVSNLYLGTVEDGALVTLLQGQLLDDRPALDVDPAALERAVGESPFTVDGQEGTTRFRVFVVASPLDTMSVIALPLDEVDAAMRQLRWAVGAGIAVIAGVLVIAMWSVQRLGLRPIAAVTEAADAIARGEHERRIPDPSPRTEAGKLATAFNVMLDERDASDARLRQFVADASHELRTPLTSIRGYLDFYREGGFHAEGELDEMVRRMSREAHRMTELVEDLLLLAELDQHRPLREERVDLGSLVRDAATDAQVLQPERRIAVDVDPPEPVDTDGDAYRLQQVIGVLVTNALVHTSTDASLSLSARATPEGAEIVVADDGPGLEPAAAARVFDRFFRGDQSRARRTGGSGLGLAIAKSIVEAHGGTITLETAPGRGCQFRITLPAKTLRPGVEQQPLLRRVDHAR